MSLNVDTKTGGVRQWPVEVVYMDLQEVLPAYDEFHNPIEFASTVVAAALGANIEDLLSRQRQALKILEQASVAKEDVEGVVHGYSLHPKIKVCLGFKWVNHGRWEITIVPLKIGADVTCTDAAFE